MSKENEYNNFSVNEFLKKHKGEPFPTAKPRLIMHLQKEVVDYLKEKGYDFDASKFEIKQISPADAERLRNKK